MATSIIKTINPVIASVTADGVKTRAQLMNQLFALIDTSKLTDQSALEIENNSFVSVFTLYYKTPSEARFFRVVTGSDYVSVDDLLLSSGSQAYSGKIQGSSYTRENIGTTVLGNGIIIRIRN